MGKTVKPHLKKNSQHPIRPIMLEAFKECPIIPSLRREDQFPLLLKSRSRVVLISSGSIFTICSFSKQLHQHNKLVLVHIDLIGGLGRDQTAVRFLKEMAEVDGIVSPHCQVIAAGRKEGMLTVHRLFAYDSPSVETGIKVLQKANPDFIEVLPGLAVLPTISCLRQNFKQPIIAAGLIKTPTEVRRVIRAGAVAVDTSAEELWNLDPKDIY